MKISLVLFNYCQAKYLPESLQAILAQTDPPDEIILFDDASTDESVDLLKKIPGARCYFNKVNQGLFANIDKALQVAEHEYIVLSAADDLLHPYFIEEHRKLLKMRPDVGLICSDCVFFEDTFPRKNEVFRQLAVSGPQIYSPKETVAIFRDTPFQILSFTTVYNRLLIQKYGGYQRELQSLADFHLNMQIALRHPIGYIPLPLGAARIVLNSYGESLRKNKKQRMKIYDEWFKFVHEKESQDFRLLFEEARLFSFGGLYTLYYIFWTPRYWRCFPQLIKKNWKWNLHKIFCKMRGRSFPRMPCKSRIGHWP